MGRILVQILALKQMRNCHMAVSHLSNEIKLCFGGTSAKRFRDLPRPQQELPRQFLCCWVPPRNASAGFRDAGRSFRGCNFSTICFRELPRVEFWSKVLPRPARGSKFLWLAQIISAELQSCSCRALGLPTSPSFPWRPFQGQAWSSKPF